MLSTSHNSWLKMFKTWEILDRQSRVCEFEPFTNCQFFLSYFFFRYDSFRMKPEQRTDCLRTVVSANRFWIVVGPIFISWSRRTALHATFSPSNNFRGGTKIINCAPIALTCTVIMYFPLFFVPFQGRWRQIYGLLIYS